MALRINHIKTHIVERLTDGYFLQFLVHQIGRREDGTLRGSIDIIEVIALWRRDGHQFLTAR